MSPVEEILKQYYETHDTRDLALLFETYMKELGATKLDRRKKDTSNTYTIDGDSTHWNRVECYYYKNSDDWKEYGKFNFCITLRKRSGNYLLIEMGSPDGDIKRPYEISYGKVLSYDKVLMKELIKQHPKLFAMMCSL